MNTYSIRYNRTTNHIAGLNCGDDQFTMNACGSLTRSNLAYGKSFETVTEALEAARIAGGRKLCKNCEKAAERMIEAEAAQAEEIAEEVTETEAPKMAIIWTTEDGTRTGTTPVTSHEEADTRIFMYRRQGLRAVKTFA